MADLEVRFRVREKIPMSVFTAGSLTRLVSEPRSARNVAAPLVVFWAAVLIGYLALDTATATAASSRPFLVQDSTQSAATPTDEQKAVASYQALQNNLYEASPKLYESLPSSSCDPYSCLWPFSNAMAGTEFLEGTPGVSSYATAVKARLKGLLAYADLNEISPSGASQPRAFESAVASPEGPGGNTYYDDNAWSALDLLGAHQLAGNPTDLSLAQDTFDFIVSGRDTSTTDGCPGGVFWEDVSGSQRNTAANAGGAEVGLELYQFTKDSSDLSWATQISSG
jgi:Glycosyl hydrolase family 76